MSLRSIKITGVVLAGGLARRMGGGDKGLIDFAGRPLIHYALSAIRPVVDDAMINANRNHDKYREFGCPVVADRNRSFDGPLAGILSAMARSDADYLLTVPCDCPLIDSAILGRMVAAIEMEPLDCLVADDGERLHPVVMLLDRRLEDDLGAYLDSGERKIDRWFMRHRWKPVDFSDRPGVFRNINTPEELAALEHELSSWRETEC
ncbi:MAG: molybdenum cofactor guanylyltransferase [Methylococcaceae bacterium]|nr:molybdenum cofactor guanylyltransferase [Methylococcaceae bacterium]MCI0667894.1 molybdenum cofactor guanylyltransferase [Methylococcaceae bacterium]MCI0732836.1 molybdenum cofactor guanylyltransferase [Methylococcaceae bacterium]